MFTSMDKAIAALLSSVMYLLGAFGMDVTFMVDQMVWLMPALVMVFTWFVPNKVPA